MSDPSHGVGSGIGAGGNSMPGEEVETPHRCTCGVQNRRTSTVAGERKKSKRGYESIDGWPVVDRPSAHERC
jgi:hypothetical protein